MPDAALLVHCLLFSPFGIVPDVLVGVVVLGSNGSLDAASQVLGVGGCHQAFGHYGQYGRLGTDVFFHFVELFEWVGWGGRGDSAPCRLGG